MTDDLRAARRQLAQQYSRKLQAWIAWHAVEKGVSAPTDGYVPFSHELALVLGWLRQDAQGDSDEAAWERVIDHAHAVINDYLGNPAALSERDLALMRARDIVRETLVEMALDANPSANPEQIRVVAAFKALLLSDHEVIQLMEGD